VLNALKHAFPEDKTDGRIVVAYKVNGSDWQLSIADNGTGIRSDGTDVAKAGLGTSIVNALAQQLGAVVDVVGGEGGTTVTISHKATTNTQFPRAA
jgi:two-component sensor histidine kinase